MTKQELTVRETAEKLGIGADRVYALVWSKKLSATKRRGRWFIVGRDAEARLKAREDALTS